MVTFLHSTITQPSKFRTKNWFQANDDRRWVTFASFANCMSEINNKQVDNVKDNNVVMTMYNLIESSDTYTKTSGSLCLYRDESSYNIADIQTFKFKAK